MELMVGILAGLIIGLVLLNGILVERTSRVSTAQARAAVEMTLTTLRATKSAQDRLMSVLGVESAYFIQQRQLAQVQAQAAVARVAALGQTAVAEETPQEDNLGHSFDVIPTPAHGGTRG